MPFGGYRIPRFAKSLYVRDTQVSSSASSLVSNTPLSIEQANGARLLGLTYPGIVPAVRSGLPFAAFERLRAFVGISAQDLGDLLRIPQRTLARRKQEGRLTPVESDRLLRLARIAEMAVYVWEDNAEAAVRWLTTSKSLLGGESPLQHTDTGPGAREVEDMLYAIEFTTAA